MMGEILYFAHRHFRSLVLVTVVAMVAVAAFAALAIAPS